jgi:ribulose-5-phosphate 4-epimerase/fuculose-1-phosphate aldolase
MTRLQRAIRDLVIANRILAHENVVDGYGHISLRHPDDPALFLLSRSRSPERVEEGDIVTFRMDGSAADGDTRPPYLERFIHAGIYQARPEVNSVVHAHSEDVMPFGLTAAKLRVVMHSASDIGANVPVWDIEDQFGDATDLLVRNLDHGADLARALGPNNVVLMRGHGFTAASWSMQMLIRIAVYLPRNARIQLAAMRLGDFKPLSANEIATRVKSLRPGSPEINRGWETWAIRAGVGDLLATE